MNEMTIETLIDQSSVEKMTGLSREVLRKWELRYRFPDPARGSRGERLYSVATVERLQLVSQLLAQGIRPRAVVGLSAASLRKLLRDTGIASQESQTQLVDELMACFKTGVPASSISHFLVGHIRKVGLGHFLEHEFGLFNAAIGLGWSQNQLSIFFEHLYTETMRTVILQLIAVLPLQANAGRALLTTPQGEVHSLGILGVQAALGLLGVECISLGTQTPPLEVVQAANNYQVHVVAISVSSNHPQSASRAYLLTLRENLPGNIALWVGGAGAVSLALPIFPKVEVFSSLSQMQSAWRALKATAA
jgi:methylmalonyl-CoA mutase cobalamin-binding subunit/DNA-binding transcriptional MerR regulator